GQIDDTELRHLLVVLFNAGYDTSKNMITLIMHMMLSHPDYWERCATDYDYCSKVVEEMFRRITCRNRFTVRGVKALKMLSRIRLCLSPEMARMFSAMKRAQGVSSSTP
ncbi:MAG: cytochrome P450, partial [Rhizobiaceae bacterium]